MSKIKNHCKTGCACKAHTTRPTGKVHWIQGLSADDLPIGRTHLSFDPYCLTTVCGAVINTPRIRQGARGSKPCQACIKAYVKKYNSILIKQEFANIIYSKYKIVSIFMLVAQEPGVVKVPFQDLKVGYVFYSECEGKLDVDPEGEFLFVVIDAPKVIEYDTDLKPINHMVKVESLASRFKTLRSEYTGLKQLVALNH